MQGDYFISFTDDATRVNDMSVYDKDMPNHITVCKVYISRNVIKIKYGTKSVTLPDIEDCDLTVVEDVLNLIKEYCAEYPKDMAAFDFCRLTDDKGDTTYITESKYHSTTDHNSHHDDDYDSKDYKDIVNQGSRLREEDNYATLKMTVMTMKEEFDHRISSLEESIKNLQNTIEKQCNNNNITEDTLSMFADKITTYVNDRIYDIREDISKINTVLNSVVLVDKILR